MPVRSTPEARHHDPLCIVPGEGDSQQAPAGSAPQGGDHRGVIGGGPGTPEDGGQLRAKGVQGPQDHGATPMKLPLFFALPGLILAAIARAFLTGEWEIRLPD